VLNRCRVAGAEILSRRCKAGEECRSLVQRWHRGGDVEVVQRWRGVHSILICGAQIQNKCRGVVAGTGDAKMGLMSRYRG